MKVAIDVQTTLGQPTGFGFYVSNLTKNLQKLGGQVDLVPVRPRLQKDFSTPQRLIWDQFTFPRLAGGHKVDLIHQPCFSAPLFFRKPVVVTIHDIISILYPKNIPFASRMFYSKWMPFSYRRAAQIITISESTKRDIVKVLGINKDKITVIPLAVDDKFKKAVTPAQLHQVKKKYHLPAKYILHIGTLEPRKNLGLLIKAFSEVIKDEKFADLSLVITGKKGWYYEGLFDLVRELNVGQRVVFTGYFDEKDKPALYQGATVFAFPSLYEGFGLPPLEAMASGVPVISSNTSSMPEVVGEAGILIAPDDERAWVLNLKKVLSDRVLREEMIQKNKEQVKKFSWDKTAQKTIAVYQKTISQNARK